MDWSIADAISLSLLPIFLFIIGLVIYDISYWIIPVTILVSVLSVELMKPLIPSNRPDEASDCDLFCINGPVGGQPGFPSGHMTMTTVIASFLFYFSPNAYSFIIGLTYIAAMAYSRYAKSCHTPLQILAGTFYGYLCVFVVTNTGIYHLDRTYQDLKSSTSHIVLDPPAGDSQV
jgi:membrane-associated phospholipid phosphatase